VVTRRCPDRVRPPGFHQQSFLYILDARKGSTEQLTEEGREVSVDWSPNSSDILFTRHEAIPPGTRFTPNDLYLIAPDGTNERQLTHDRVSMNGAWSPDGTKIAFESYRPSMGPETDIYLMNADGSGRARLTAGPGLDYGPVWSPDGSRILFVSRRTAEEGFESASQVLVVRPDGSQLTSLREDPSNACSADPSWAVPSDQVEETQASGDSGATPPPVSSVERVLDVESLPGGVDVPGVNGRLIARGVVDDRPWTLSVTPGANQDAVCLHLNSGRVCGGPSGRGTRAGAISMFTSSESVAFQGSSLTFVYGPVVKRVHEVVVAFQDDTELRTRPIEGPPEFDVNFYVVGIRGTVLPRSVRALDAEDQLVGTVTRE
jgi:hypothetical protein